MLLQTDGGAIKVENDEPKTVSKFTDRYICCDCSGKNHWHGLQE